MAVLDSTVGNNSHFAFTRQWPDVKPFSVFRLCLTLFSSLYCMLKPDF